MSQTITDTARYSFHVTWSPEDAEFIATCVEFPSLSWLAGTPEEALTGLRIVVDEVVDDMRANDEPVPEPLSTRHYSGKFQPVRHAQTGRLLNARSVTPPRAQFLGKSQSLQSLAPQAGRRPHLLSTIQLHRCGQLCGDHDRGRQLSRLHGHGTTTRQP